MPWVSVPFNRWFTIVITHVRINQLLCLSLSLSLFFFISVARLSFQRYGLRRHGAGARTHSGSPICQAHECEPSYRCTGSGRQGAYRDDGLLEKVSICKVQNVSTFKRSLPLRPVIGHQLLEAHRQRRQSPAL